MILWPIKAPNEDEEKNLEVICKNIVTLWGCYAKWNKLCSKVDKPSGHYAEGNKAGTKNQYHMISLICAL